MTVMTIFTLIADILFIIWLFLTAWIGWKILDSMQKQTTKLINILMDTVVHSSEMAKLSAEKAQRMVALLEKKLNDGTP